MTDAEVNSAMAVMMVAVMVVVIRSIGARVIIMLLDDDGTNLPNDLCRLWLILHRIDHSIAHALLLEHNEIIGRESLGHSLGANLVDDHFIAESSLRHADNFGQRNTLGPLLLLLVLLLAINVLPRLLIVDGTAQDRSAERPDRAANCGTRQRIATFLTNRRSNPSTCQSAEDA